ncbi:MAG: glycosyl hydrolase family 8 [bacterium]
MMIRIVVALMMSTVASTAAWATAPLRPFGSHPVTYAAGTIRPNHVPQATLDQQVSTFYDAWKAKYLRQGCGEGRYYVLTKTQSGNQTVSEGQGYGMLLTVLMAGYDPQAQTIFDGMYAYFSDHPTETHDHLMAWYQNTSCNDAQGRDSATDGDLDVALALLLADKQWGGCETIDYRAEALKVIADIADGERDPSAAIMWLGDWVGDSSARNRAATRSSDIMPGHLRSFAAASRDASWTHLLDASYSLVTDVQTRLSPSTGLLPDFIENALSTPTAAAANFLEGPNDGAYDYNACRVPWRLGTDAVVSGDVRARNAVQRLNSWIQTAAGGDPTHIASGYRLNGTVSSGANYQSMAFIAPFGVAAMADASSQAWLNAIWDRVVATPASAEGYYENSLKLLSMLVMSGNWWNPEAVRGTACVPQEVPTPQPGSCQGGGTLNGARLVVGGLNASAGNQSIKLKGTLSLPAGVSAAFTDGAQVLIEDLGGGGRALFALTADTTPIPPAAAGACDARHDGWRATGSRFTYRNASNAMDPPMCTAGSARGLRSLAYRQGHEGEIAVSLNTKGTALAAPLVGPLRATVILGGAAAAASGACGVSPTLRCRGNDRTKRCS